MVTQDLRFWADKGFILFVVGSFQTASALQLIAAFESGATLERQSFGLLSALGGPAWQSSCRRVQDATAPIGAECAFHDFNSNHCELA